MKNKPREYTTEEVQERFINYIWSLIDYWDSLPKETPTMDDIPIQNTQRRRLSGLAHSILATLDGDTNLPRFIVAPMPHPFDKKFRSEIGENYYPDNDRSKVNADIAGPLHEQLYKNRSN